MMIIELLIGGVMENGSGVVMEEKRFRSDCETCQQNWDLLNHNQALNPVDPGWDRKLKQEEQSSRDTGLVTIASMQPMEGNSAACLNFDLDGLLPSVDRQQVRLGQILAAKDVISSFIDHPLVDVNWFFYEFFFFFFFFFKFF